MISYWGVEHGDVVSKGWVSDRFNTRRAARLERKGKEEWVWGDRDTGAKLSQKADKVWGKVSQKHQSKLWAEELAARKERSKLYQ